jgi:hypothetical protein
MEYPERFTVSRSYRLGTAPTLSRVTMSRPCGDFLSSDCRHMAFARDAAKRVRHRPNADAIFLNCEQSVALDFIQPVRPIIIATVLEMELLALCKNPALQAPFHIPPFRVFFVSLLLISMQQQNSVLRAHDSRRIARKESVRIRFELRPITQEAEHRATSNYRPALNLLLHFWNQAVTNLFLTQRPELAVR